MFTSSRHRTIEPRRHTAAERGDEGLHQSREIGVGHTDGVGVRASREDDRRACRQMPIDIDRQAVEVTEGRHRASLAVREGRGELPLARQVHILRLNDRMCACHVDLIGRWQNQHGQLAVSDDHHHLCQLLIGDVLCERRIMGGVGAAVMLS